MLADDILGIGKILLQDVAFIVRNFADIARFDAKPVVGKDGEGRGLLVERKISGAKNHRQELRDGRDNAEAARIIGDSRYADFLRQLDRWDVARFGHGMAQSDVAFKTAIEVSRRVSRAAAIEGGRRIQDDVIRAGALIDGGGK